MFFGHKRRETQPDLANLKITDAQVGDTLSVSGAAEDFSDIDFTVDVRGRPPPARWRLRA